MDSSISLFMNPYGERLDDSKHVPSDKAILGSWLEILCIDPAEELECSSRFGNVAGFRVRSLRRLSRLRMINRRALSDLERVADRFNTIQAYRLDQISRQTRPGEGRMFLYDTECDAADR